MKVLTWFRQFKNRIAQQGVSNNQLIVMTCLYLALICNIPFLHLTFNAVVALPEYSLGFLASVPVLLFCLMVIINSVLGMSFLLKPILVISVVMSSLLFYATFTYGIVFDKNMIQNGLETDLAEALTYFNAYALAFIFVAGILPAYLIVKVKLIKQVPVREFFSRAKLVALHSILIGLIAAVYFANYAAVGRNNDHLLSYITPYKFVDASIHYADRHYFSPPLPFTLLDTMPFIQSASNTPKVTVLVIGETARAQSFSLNGYAQKTNQYTEQYGVVSFSNMWSCGTATAVSLPCMFSRLDRNNYDNRHANAQQNLLDLASIAGMDVLWIDNNNGSCKGVCARVNAIDISTDPANPLCDGEYCLDEALLAPLQDKLEHLSAKNTLIVLHMMGSHGPTYYKRYPSDKRHFLPDCQRSDIQHCSQQAVINTYDNTIAYTDFVLSEIITRLDELSSNKQFETAMLYVSDHGESLGEKGVYLHGLPYAFAPEEQTHVPMLFWQPDVANIQTSNCYQSASKEAISHDNLFDIVLGITSISSDQYQLQRDKLAPCRQGDEALASMSPINAAIGSIDAGN